MWAQWMTQGVESIPTSPRGKKAEAKVRKAVWSRALLCLWASVLSHVNVLGVEEETVSERPQICLSSAPLNQ